MRFIIYELLYNNKNEENDNSLNIKNKVPDLHLLLKIKNNQFVGYFINDKNNPFFNSPVFSSLISKIQTLNKIVSIKDTTPLPHNGTRPPKKRRV